MTEKIEVKILTLNNSVIMTELKNESYLYVKFEV